MNNETKILLTINLEGGTFMKSDKYEIRKWCITKKDLNSQVKFKGKDGDKIIKSGKYKYYPLVNSDCYLKTSISREGYDYMTSAMCPEWYPEKKKWGRLTAEQRLNAHFQRTCEHHNGIGFSYKILED